jgi:hypothetical protein
MTASVAANPAAGGPPSAAVATVHPRVMITLRSHEFTEHLNLASGTLGSWNNTRSDFRQFSAGKTR